MNNNDDLDTDKDLSYEDKKQIREARENSLKIKEIRANMTDEEKKDIDNQVALASTGLNIKREERLNKSEEESDIDFGERATFALKEKDY